MATQPDADPLDEGQGAIDDFRVTLEVFEGPFDLLLQLITRKRLDITEVSLSEVTDEFIAHMQIFPDLSRTTEFLIVAATLLDLKAATLLPRPEGETDLLPEDLEARDLLFSRLLQYRAFKQASAAISARLDEFADYVPRLAPLEPHFAALLPELMWAATPQDLAMAAASAFTRAEPGVVVTHLHDPVVPVREQARVVADKLRAAGSATFHELIADAATTAVIVSRFLAVLELFRRRTIEFRQDEPLGDLVLTWTGSADKDVDIDEPDYDSTTEEGTADE